LIKILACKGNIIKLKNKPSKTTVAKAQPSKKRPSRSDKPSEAKATHSTTPPKRWRSRVIPRPASFFLREEIGRIVAKRRGCCLSEASFSTFRYKPHNFSKKNAALTFCFFWVKPKEKAFGVKPKENNKSNFTFVT